MTQLSLWVPGWANRMCLLLCVRCFESLCRFGTNLPAEVSVGWLLTKLAISPHTSGGVRWLQDGVWGQEFYSWSELCVLSPPSPLGTPCLAFPFPTQSCQPCRLSERLLLYCLEREHGGDQFGEHWEACQQSGHSDHLRRRTAHGWSFSCCNGARENFAACAEKNHDRDESEDKSKIEVESVVTAAVLDKLKEIECKMLPEATMMENSSLVDDQRHANLRSVGLFLNLAQKTEFDHITTTTIERARDYFRSLSCTLPAALALLCPHLVSACSLAGPPYDCSLLFSRY